MTYISQNMEPSQNSTSGYLEIILGPMFSGKTSKLLQIYKQCQYCNLNVVVINHSSDTRYHDTMLSTHDKQMIPCLQTNKLYTLWRNQNEQLDPEPNNMNTLNKLKEADVILINEGQFFEDVYECVKEMVENNKRVFISGLDGDYKREKFGRLLDLIPFSDHVYKITSLCGICKNGRSAVFSMRVTDEKQQTVIGTDNYIPVCRSCYNKNSVA